MPSGEDNNKVRGLWDDRSVVFLLKRRILRLKMNGEGVRDGVNAAKKERQHPKHHEENPEIPRESPKPHPLQAWWFFRLTRGEADEDNTEENQLQCNRHWIDVA